MKTTKKQKEKTFTQDWDEKDFDAIHTAIYNYFAGRVFVNHRNENVLFPYNMERIELILGLPYTSSGVNPQIALDCNVHILYPKNTRFHYDFVALDEEKNVVFVLSDEEENRKYINVLNC